MELNFFLKIWSHPDRQWNWIVLPSGHVCNAFCVVFFYSFLNNLSLWCQNVQLSLPAAIKVNYNTVERAPLSLSFLICKMECVGKQHDMRKPRGNILWTIKARARLLNSDKGPHRLSASLSSSTTFWICFSGGLEKTSSKFLQLHINFILLYITCSARETEMKSSGT